MARATKRTRRRLRDKLHAHSSEHAGVGVHLRKRFSKSRVDCVISTRVSFKGWFRAQEAYPHQNYVARALHVVAAIKTPCKTRSAKLDFKSSRATESTLQPCLDLTVWVYICFFKASQPHRTGLLRSPLR